MTSILIKFHRMSFFRFQQLRRIFEPIRIKALTVVPLKPGSHNLKYLPQKSSKQAVEVVPSILCFSILSWLGLEVPEEEEDELIITMKRSILLIRRRQFDTAEQMLHVALRLAQQLQNQLAITYIYDLMANLALERTQLEKAQKLFVNVMQRLLENGIKEDDLKMIHISLKLSRINHLKKDFATAQIGYEWCLEKLEKYAGDKDSDGVKLLAMARNWYGLLLSDGGKVESGLNYILEAYDSYSNFDDRDEEQIVIQLSDIGTLYEKLGEYDKSENYFNEAIQRGKVLDKMEQLGVVYINLGRLYVKKRLYDMAKKRCGYGWRLGNERKNEDIKNEAIKCLDQIKSVVG